MSDVSGSNVVTRLLRSVPTPAPTQREHRGAASMTGTTGSLEA